MGNRFHTEVVDIYTPSLVTTSAGDNVPGTATKTSSSVPCAIHQGLTDPEDTTTSTGPIQNATAKVYFGLTDLVGQNLTTILTAQLQTNTVPDRCLLYDQGTGDLWLVRGDPERHGRFAATSYISVIVEKMTFDVDGVPAVDP